MLLSRVQPTLSRYATNASRSANPGLWRGLVGAWVPSLGVQGQQIQDISGHGRSAAMTGFAPDDWTPTGLRYDAGRLALSPLRITEYASELTIEAMVYLPTYNYQSLFGANDTASNENFVLKLRLDGEAPWWRVQTAGGQENIFYTSPQRTGWQHYALTLKGSTVQVYLNGVLEQERALSGAVQLSSNPFSVGSYNSGFESFIGTLRKASVYSRALSAAEIARLSADPLAPFRLRERSRVFIPAPTSASTGAAAIVRRKRPGVPTLSTRAFNPTQSRRPELWDGLVGAWVPALGIQGATLWDLSGSGRNSSFNGSWGIAGSRGVVAQFNGSSHHAETSGSVAYSGSGRVTLSFGLDSSAIGAGTRMIIESSTDFNNGSVSAARFALYFDGNILVYLRSSDYYGGSYARPSDGWHDYVVTLDTTSANSVGLWIDGAFQGYKTGPVNNAPFADNPLYLMSRGGSSLYAGGAVDRFLVHSRLLSAQEMNQLSADHLAPWRRAERRSRRAGSTQPVSTFKPFFIPRRHRWGLA